MTDICLMTAAAITGLTKRTLWRYIERGKLRSSPDRGAGRTLVVLEELLKFAKAELSAEDIALAEAADRAEIGAECELGIWLLEAGRSSQAADWLLRAARAGDPDAMHWLAHCSLVGLGVTRDEAGALVWLTQAAKAGHSVAKRQLAALSGSLVARVG